LCVRDFSRSGGRCYAERGVKIVGMGALVHVWPCVEGVDSPARRGVDLGLGTANAHPKRISYFDLKKSGVATGPVAP